LVGGIGKGREGNGKELKYQEEVENIEKEIQRGKKETF